MSNENTTIGKFQFNGLPNNPWNGIVVEIISTPDGKLMDTNRNFTWSKQKFAQEQNDGLWEQLSTKNNPSLDTRDQQD